MWSKYSDAIIWGTYCITLWVFYRAYISVKAKAFNEGFKRGRASVQYVRERS